MLARQVHRLMGRHSGMSSAVGVWIRRSGVLTSRLMLTLTDGQGEQ